MIFIPQNFLKLYTLFCVIEIFVLFTFQSIILNDDTYFSLLEERLTYEKIEKMINDSKQTQWVGYVLIPFIYFIKVSLMAIILYVGVFFRNIKVSLKDLMFVSLLSEFVFLLSTSIKTLWFLFIQTDYTLQNIQYFYPLSALNLLDYEQVDLFLVYPLQTLNLFELLYWFVLAYGISKLIKTNLEGGMKIVLSSYVPALFLWVVFVTFLTINMT